MGTVEWFLGIHFTWDKSDDGHLSVHLNQSGFVQNLAENFGREDKVQTPNATPYRSGLPIDSIPGHNPKDESPAHLRRKQAYQSLVGSTGWLSMSTCPNLSTIHSFLSSYNMCPAAGHLF